VPVTWRQYAVALACGTVSELALALILRGFGDRAAAVSLLFLVEAAILGILFGPRPGMLAACAPIVVFAAIDLLTTSGDHGEEVSGFVFLLLLLGFVAGMAGALRARYGTPPWQRDSGPAPRS
jgi:hypothetical protein